MSKKTELPAETEIMLLRSRYWREKLSRESPRWHKRFAKLTAEGWLKPAKRPYISPYLVHE